MVLAFLLPRLNGEALEVSIIRLVVTADGFGRLEVEVDVNIPDFTQNSFSVRLVLLPSSEGSIS